MLPALPFLLVGAGEVWLGAWLPPWAGWAPAWAGLATGWVGLAYLMRRPGWLAKDHPGRVLLWPFLLWARGAARIGARIGPAPRVEVAPGLWVGGWPHAGAPGFAQLDLTAELPRRGAAVRYACFPMLDGAPAGAAEFEAAVAQARAWRREGLPVLVHCAYGHGRSVAVCIGVMVAEGLAPTWEDSHARVLAVRPLVRMTPGQRRMLARRTRPATRSDARLS